MTGAIYTTRVAGARATHTCEIVPINYVVKDRCADIAARKAGLVRRVLGIRGLAPTGSVVDGQEEGKPHSVITLCHLSILLF